VRDEADRIGGCLRSLDRQHHLPSRVVLLLNNCTDATEAVARQIAVDLRFSLEVITTDLPPEKTGAGHARYLAMTAAASHASPNDVLLTTDADVVAPRDWVKRNLDTIAAGAEVVCGRALIDPVEALSLPQQLHADDARERRLASLLDTLAWHLDPEPHDPPPRHGEASGASIGVVIEAYRRVGGVPDIASGEDRAFVRALWMMDAKIRHNPAIFVTVSGRTIGRARDGMADTLRRRIVQQDEFIDAQIEPAANAYRRYQLRRRFRNAWAWGSRSSSNLSVELGVSAACLYQAVASPFFGQGWAMVEAESSVLRRQRVRFKDLPTEIAAAESLIRTASALRSTHLFA
jgi:GT2 family glycosyltransferase